MNSINKPIMEIEERASRIYKKLTQKEKLELDLNTKAEQRMHTFLMRPETYEEVFDLIEMGKEDYELAEKEKKKIPPSFPKRILQLAAIKQDYSDMTEEEKKARIKFLWDKVRIVMRVRWLWKAVVRDMYEGKRCTFGLDPDEIGIMDTEYVVEYQLDEKVI